MNSGPSSCSISERYTSNSRLRPGPQRTSRVQMMHLKGHFDVSSIQRIFGTGVTIRPVSGSKRAASESCERRLRRLENRRFNETMYPFLQAFQNIDNGFSTAAITERVRVRRKTLPPGARGFEILQYFEQGL